MRRTTLAASAALLLGACAVAPLQPTLAPPASSEARLGELGDQMVALQIRNAPTSAYWLGVKTADHSRWQDRSPEGLAAFEREGAQILAELKKLDVSSLPSAKLRTQHAAMVESLRATQGARICRSELWANVSHMGGWHLNLVDIAREQPVGTADERAQALTRWSSLPTLVAQEIANARSGLVQRYSAPKPVVRKVIKQVEGLLAAAPEQSPFFSPAERSADAEFKAEYTRILAGPVRSALSTYLSFLRDEYLAQARDSLGVSAHPNGAACYQAALREITTLDRAPEEVFRLGQETVAANTAFVLRMGEKKFGTSDLPSIVGRINEAPDNRFKSEAELISFSRAVVDRARAKSAPLFLSLPVQEMRVEPFLAFQRGSGGSSFYEQDLDPMKPAYYRIASEHWATDTRGSAEITAVHEGYPGHHMQIAFANSLGAGPIVKLTGNSAYVEGWARYSEMLTEEAGIYETDYALMTRRLWPARGMVADPGLHLYGWSREKVLAYLRESGRFSGSAGDDLIDRMAIWPGQLTAYDSGGLEIMALRREAEAELGAKFDIRQFHQRVLEQGSIPLGVLRANIRNWIAEVKRGQ